MEITEPQLILLTKLHRPPLMGGLVPRPQLYAHLDSSLHYPLTLISAPAGFGKSTLLSAWLAHSDVPFAWLSLDAGDNDLAVFLSYFIAAVRSVHAGACANTEAMIRLASLPDDAVLAHQLINELETLPTAFVLVLDDYDALRDRAVHQLVATIVRRPPQPLRLVIAARQDPPLPLPRLRAQGQMLELRSADLRFRRAETLTFLRQIPDLMIDEAGMTLLDAAVEGWPAGLRLATLSLRLSGDPAATLATLAGGHAYAADYLFSEILTALPQDRQAWLLRITIADRFCAGLCDVLCQSPGSTTAWPNGEAFIQWLQAANLFLVPLDNEGEWFRFHHLFLQLLRQRLHALYTADALAELQRKAAAWMAAAGMVEEALHHFLLAEDLDGAADVVLQARQQVVNQEDWPRLARWLDLFPAEYIKRTPELWIIQAWVLLSRFRLAELEQHLDQIEAHQDRLRARMTATDAEILAGEIAGLRSQNRYWATDGAQSIALAQRALEMPTGSTMVRGSSLLYLGLAMQMTGEQVKGFETLTQVFASDEARQDSRFAARILIALTGMHWVAADLSASERSARQLLQLGTQHHLLASQGWGHFYLGCVYYWRNELPEAAAHFGALVERPYGVNSLAAVHSHFGLAMTFVAQDRRVDAVEVLEAAFALAAQAGSTSLLRQVQACEAHLALLQGKKSIATNWADQNADTRPWLPRRSLAEIPALTWASVRIMQGTQASLAQADAALADVRRFVMETHNTIRLIDVLALEALLHAARGERPVALACLQQALTLAEPRGIVRPFVDLGPNMAALLHESAKQDISLDYAGRLLATFPEQGVQGVAHAALMQVEPGTMIEPLTDRELDVLALLGRRLSNKEIAQILVVSPFTVKAHMRNLFGKLQVSTRREAVARAHSLGLLRAS